MLFCHFQYFKFCNTDMSFVKMTNFRSSTMLKTFMIWKPFICIWKKSPFCCLFFLNSGNISYFVSLNSRISANSYCSIANWGYLYYQVSKNGSLKCNFVFLIFSFWQLGNFNINFVENFMKNPFLGRKPFLRQFSKVLLKFYHVTIFKDVATLDSKMAAMFMVYFEDFVVLWVQP